MKTFMVLIFIFIVTLPAFGDGLDRPNFCNPPTQYIYKHIVQDAIGEKVDTEDELLIGDRDDQKLTFWFYITAKNFHVCCMTGIATAIKKNEYVFTEGNCNLIIKIKGQEVQLFDPNDKCKKSYCGMYAFINGVKFTKTK